MISSWVMLRAPCRMAVAALEDGHLMAGTVELRRGGEARRPRADHRNALAGADGGWLRLDPPLGEGAVRDRLLDHLDVHRRQIDRHRAAPLAGRRADPSGELGEVVRLREPDAGFLPLPSPDEVVPFRDEVVHRAPASHATEDLARVAERDRAIHAAAALLAQRLLGDPEMHLLPVADAPQVRALVTGLAGVAAEAGPLADP